MSSNFKGLLSGHALCCFTMWLAESSVTLKMFICQSSKDFRFPQLATGRNCFELELFVFAEAFF